MLPNGPSGQSARRIKSLSGALNQYRGVSDNSHSMDVSMRSAIIIPTITDLNRGDQALVWEAGRFIVDAGLAESIGVVHAGGENLEFIPEQTREEGYHLLEGLQPDPRRGRSHQHEKLNDGWWSFVLLAAYGLYDFLVGAWVLLMVPWAALARLPLNRKQRETLSAFREAEVCVVKGGGFLHANGELRAPYYVWYQLYYMRLAQRLGKPVLILPNSFGPFKGLTVKWQMRQVLSKCQFIAARESISAEALSKLLKRPVPTYPDMGYFLRGADPEVGRQICRDAGVPLGQKPCVAFTVRPWRFPGLSNPVERYNQYLHSIAALVRYATTRGFHPVLVAHVLGPGAHENDRFAIEELISRLDGVEKTYLNVPGTCRELKAVYGEMDLVVGTRFHSVIFAQGSAVPSMAVAYGGNKGEGIMNDLGLEDFSIPISSISSETLCRVFDDLIARSNQVRSRLVRWQTECLESRCEMIARVAPDQAVHQRRVA